MREYEIDVIIKNKPIVKDPEGETILKDLIHKQGYDTITSARAGKLISLRVKAANGEKAKKITYDMCNELRIYNPVVHTLDIKVKGE